MAVASDERFRETKTRWIFWAVSDDIAPNIRVRARNRIGQRVWFLMCPELRLSVWVKSWGQVLESCRGRLEFFRRNLQYEADDESAIALLKKLHAKYLPPVLTGEDSKLESMNSPALHFQNGEAYTNAQADFRHRS